MSRENLGVVRGVRTPVVVPPGTRRRSFDERVLVRFPALARPLRWAWSRLPPRSRFRRAWLARNVRVGCEAANRRDFDFLFLSVHPDVEFHVIESPGGEVAAPDVLGVHRGHDGYRRVWKTVLEVMEDFRLDFEEVIDFGDQILTCGRASGHGNLSGIPVSGGLFQLYTLRRGLVVRQEDFAHRDAAFNAVGVQE
jgi:ketosteroid isomerase-like protein